MKNLHLDHLEDRIFIDGPLSVVDRIDSLLDMLEGKEGARLSVKMDGAPSFVCGKHPENGRFFLGTKSAFSGKVAQKMDDISTLTDNVGLQQKLRRLFANLSMGKWNIIVQGDLLWWDEMVKHEPDMYTFQPNTLVYWVPRHSGLGQRLDGMGMLFHTQYEGASFQDLKASMYLGQDLDEIRASIPPDNVILKSFFPRLSILAVAPHEISTLRSHLFMAGKALHSCSGATLSRMYTGRLHNLVMKFVNDAVRKDLPIEARAFKIFIYTEYLREAGRLKTMNGKTRKNAEAKELVESLDDLALEKIFSAYTMVRSIKDAIITILDNSAFTKIEGIQVRLPSGEPTGHEGYVAYFPHKEDYIKLVKRHVFSKVNMLYGGKDWANN